MLDMNYPEYRTEDMTDPERTNYFTCKLVCKPEEIKRLPTIF